jgi:hypothetical protein
MDRGNGQRGAGSAPTAPASREIPTGCRALPPGSLPTGRWHYSAVADLLADVRRVRQVADVFGPASTAFSMRKVAERALEHDDEEVRRLANRYSLNSNAAQPCVVAADESGSRSGNMRARRQRGRGRRQCSLNGLNRCWSSR